MLDAIKEYLKPELIWFLLGLALLITEFAMPGLIVFFFGVGACIVAIVCLLSSYVAGSINTQLIIFIGSSVASLLLLRRWLKGIFLGHTVSKQDLRQNLEEFVGQRAVVVDKIVPKAGCKAHFTLPPILGALPALAGWGIVKPIIVAWKGPGKGGMPGRMGTDDIERYKSAGENTF